MKGRDGTVYFIAGVESHYHGFNSLDLVTLHPSDAELRADLLKLSRIYWGEHGKEVKAFQKKHRDDAESMERDPGSAGILSYLTELKDLQDRMERLDGEHIRVVVRDPGLKYMAGSIPEERFFSPD